MAVYAHIFALCINSITAISEPRQSLARLTKVPGLCEETERSRLPTPGVQTTQCTQGSRGDNGVSQHEEKVSCYYGWPSHTQTAHFEVDWTHLSCSTGEEV